MAAQQRAQRQRARQRARAQRQRERTRRRATRQENKTRRVLGRQTIRAEKVKQKGQSGFWTPEGVKARGDVGLGFLKAGSDIAATYATGGLASLIPDGGSERRSAIDDLTSDYGSGGGGGGGGGSTLAPLQEETPLYKRPIVIGGALLGGYLLYRTMGRKK